jgi:hypothetical protein
MPDPLVPFGAGAGNKNPNELLARRLEERELLWRYDPRSRYLARIPEPRTHRTHPSDLSSYSDVSEDYMEDARRAVLVTAGGDKALRTRPLVRFPRQ